MGSRTERLMGAIKAALETITGTGPSGVDLSGTVCLHPPPPSSAKTGVSFVYLIRHGDRIDSVQTQLGERDQGPTLGVDLIHTTAAGKDDLETVHLTSVRLLDEVFAALSAASWEDAVEAGEEVPDLLSVVAQTHRKNRTATAGAVYLDLLFDWPFRPVSP